MATPKAQSSAVQAYISDCIDLSGYPDTGKPAAVQVFDLFMDEFGKWPENVRRYGPATGQRHFIEWLKGMPSCLNIAYLYTEQAAWLDRWGIPYTDNDSAMSDKFYAVVYREFMHLFNLQSKKQ